MVKRYFFFIFSNSFLLFSCGQVRDVNKGEGVSSFNKDIKLQKKIGGEEQVDEGGDGDFVGNGGDDRVLISYLQQKGFHNHINLENFGEYRVYLDNISFIHKENLRVGYCYDFYRHLIQAVQAMNLMNHYEFKDIRELVEEPFALDNPVPDFLSPYGRALQEKNYALLCNSAYFQIGAIATEQGALTAANFEQTPFQMSQNAEKASKTYQSYFYAEVYTETKMPLIVLNPYEWMRLSQYSEVCESVDQSKDCLMHVRYAIAYHEYVTARHSLEPNNSYYESSRFVRGYYVPNRASLEVD